MGEQVGYTILVVDTADSREVMKLILEAEGYRVLEAENGVVAVDTALGERPHAILMDMSMPLMDGCPSHNTNAKAPGTSCYSDYRVYGL